MAYSELIKNFEKIRDYMRQFYVYGFRSRSEYTGKSARTYDDERRRVESWLGDYVGFRRDDSGKAVFLSVDSRRIPGNPLYEAFKAKTFTDRSVFLHFTLLDLLSDGVFRSVTEIQEALTDRYLTKLDAADGQEIWEPDRSTIRNKLNEYAELGILEREKDGRSYRYGRKDDSMDLSPLAEAIAFFAGSETLGVVGSYLQDRFFAGSDTLRFKHHYILYALDSEVLADLFMAMDEERDVALEVVGRKNFISRHTVYPMRIVISTQTGRQYVLGRQVKSGRFDMYRLDNIRHVIPLGPSAAAGKTEEAYQRFAKHMWGVALGRGRRNIIHIEFTVRVDEDEGYIAERLAREARVGSVLQTGPYSWKYSADVYDVDEMIPWMRTFIGRIEGIVCDDKTFANRFYKDVEAMAKAYDEEPGPGPRGVEEAVGTDSGRQPGASPAPKAETAFLPLFHEVYGRYYRIAEKILEEAARKGGITKARVNAIAGEEGFAESVLTLPGAMTEDWHLLLEGVDGKTLTSILDNEEDPSNLRLPLTLLEKRWIKAVLLDPKAALFPDESFDPDGLWPDVRPLFDPAKIVRFDQYGDGDPYDDPHYRDVFRKVMTAIREDRMIEVRFTSGKNKVRTWRCAPKKMEYSAKDDKFRVLVIKEGYDDISPVNIARVEDVRVEGPISEEMLGFPETPKKEARLLLTDDRNALDRAMLHFSHLQKETRQIDDRHFEVTLYYDAEDATEIVIRILSFGPMLQVLGDGSLRREVEARILRQMDI